MASSPALAPPRWRNSVLSVLPGTPAAEAGVHPGDRLLSINGRPVRDIIDYRFHATEAAVKLEVERRGASLGWEIHKEPDDDLGLEFASPLFDGIRVCNNRCFFCFVAGLPAGVRRSLRRKDDDYRLSFLHGSFITLTNLGEEDWARLGEQGLSPLYVSVHATDTELRRRLLGNPQAPDILDQLRRLRELGVRVHAQVVLLKGVNDGPVLEKTIADLASLHPTVASIAVVPVGRTAHHRLPRDSFFAMPPPFSQSAALDIVRHVRGWQREFQSQLGNSLVYAADEFHLLAGAPVPPAATYDGYPQYHNGIGLTRSLLDDWGQFKRRRRHHGSITKASLPSCLTLACGRLIAPVMQRLAAEVYTLLGVHLEVTPVENRFFGSSVTVSGLLTGSDLLAALAGRDLGAALLLARSSLDYDGERFLDDTTPAQVAESVGVPLVFAEDLSGALEQVEGLICAA